MGTGGVSFSMARCCKSPRHIWYEIHQVQFFEYLYWIFSLDALYNKRLTTWFERSARSICLGIKHALWISQFFKRHILCQNKGTLFR